MRVQESKQSGKTAIMGKKKHKFRKQAKENELCPSDSSDDGGNAGRCPHLSKGINLNTMKKALKQLGTLGVCTSCDGNKSIHHVHGGEAKTEDQATGGATGGTGELIMEHVEDKLFEDAEPTIWVCLQCGHQGCDRNSKEQHALKHFQTPRSNLHALVININTWAVWCYTCDDEVAPDSSRKLQECMEYLRKQAGLGTGATASATGGTTSINRTGSFKSDGQGSGDVGSLDTTAKVEPKTSKPKPISLQAAASVTQGLPKVKGLSNLGNTCFFNAVMQNLSQTYVLEMLLTERGTKGSQIHLPGHKSDSELGDDGEEDVLSDSSSASDGDSEEKRIKMSPISVSLGEPGALTLSLVSFMKDMHNPGKAGTISPNSLFSQVCKKAPRFKGFQQQDSHELLRHLMDGMKAEEIKRSQTAILKQFHLAENTNPKKVDEDTKAKVKEYGRQAKHTFVDGVFGGVFISTVQCEECHVPSQVFEPFLDISLPILEEKTVRPNNMWSWKKKDESEKEKTAVNAVEELAAVAEKGPSKHQQKKAKRQAKKEAKRKPKSSKSPEDEGPETKLDADPGGEKGDKDSDNTKTTPESHSLSDGEISDADVEDNIESDASRNRVLPLNPQEDAEKIDSPIDTAKAYVVPADNSPNCSSVVSNHMDRCDSTGRSEESTLTETSAGESKTGCSSCNSLASLSDSTCKASSVDSPFGSNTGINQATEQGISHVDDVTDGIKKLDISDPGASAQSSTLKKIKERDSSKETDKKSDRGSTGSVSLDGTEETASTSNGHHPGSGHRSRSSGYSSGTTAKSTATSSGCSRSQLRQEAKAKAMSSLAPRYHPVSHECSVRSCLNQFTAAELLTGSNKFGCETCTKKKHGNSGRDGKKDTVYTNASKQILVFQPPAVLTLHLKRFQQVGFTLRKVNRHVEFPMIMDLAPYCSSLSKGVRAGQTKVLYALYGVVEHSGRLTGGHYTAYVKVRPHSPRLRDFVHSYDYLSHSLDKLLEVLHSSQNNIEDQGEGHTADGQDGDTVAPPPGKWYYISDSRVTEVSSEAMVLRCQAYLLFYERIL